MSIDLDGKEYSPGQIARSVWDKNENRIRVDAEVTAVIGELQVALDANEDNVAISDGTNTLEVNPDGSLNVKVDDSSQINYYEITNIPSNTLTNVFTQNIISEQKMTRLQVSGTNLAEYTLLLNSQIKSKFRTNVTNLNYTLDLENFQLNPGDTLELKVIHLNASLGNFNSSYFYK